MKNKMKLLAISVLFGSSIGGSGTALAEYTPEYKSDYQVCMEYCMAPEEKNSFTYCNAAAQCGDYAKRK